MASINVIARERKSLFVVAKRYQRDVDTIQEALKRYIERVIARKRKIPEVEDVVNCIGITEMMATAVENLAELLGEMSDFFADGMTTNEAGKLKNWLQDKGWIDRQSNVISFNPEEAGNYIRIVFSNDAAAQDFIDRNPQYEDVSVGRSNR